MTVFLGDIAFYMATLVFAAGIYMIHHANHHDKGEKCKLLNSGGYIVTTIALLGMLCTGFYWMKFYFDGSYKTANVGSMQQSMMGGKGMDMNSQMMTGMMSRCLGQMPEGTKMDTAMREKMKECMASQTPNVESGSGFSPEGKKYHHE